MGSRNYVFTLNNPESNDLPDFQHARYIVWQLEKGENGTKHIQGYIELSSPRRIAALKKWLPRAHFETRKGSREQARDYCRKEDTRLEGPFERGDFGAGGVGRRNDLAEVKRKLDEGQTELSISQEHHETWIRHYRAYREYRKLVAKPRDWKTKVHVYWGASGTGKTRRAVQEAGKDAYRKPPGGWFCGYDGQPNVIFDEFYGGVQYSEMLQILDRTACWVETKGGMANWIPRNIWITSNKSPTEWYPNIEDKTALLRRLDEVIHFPKTIFNTNLTPTPPDTLEPAHAGPLQ